MKIFHSDPELEAVRQAEKERKAKAEAEIRSYRQLAKDLAPEAKLYGQIIIEVWTRLGNFYAARWKYATGTNAGALTRFGRPKTARVKFEKIITTKEAFYYKIKTRSRTFWGARSELPHQTRIADLVDSDTCFEIGATLERPVAARFDNLRHGVWIVVYREEAFDNIPAYLTFAETLPYFPADASTGTLILGVDSNRDYVYADLDTNPHILIGGGTGSGKSNIINVILCSLLQVGEPDLDLYLIDLKEMELVYYDEAPQVREIATDAKAAIAMLQRIRQEITRRKHIMRKRGRKLADFNAAHPDERLNRIIVVIDEAAELTKASGEEVRAQAIELISSMTNLGRSIGITIILATQRPSTAVVDNAIKINMPLVIGGRVRNRAQSEVIIGSSGLERLPKIPGRMLILEGIDPVEVQTPFISDEAVAQSIKIAQHRCANIVRTNLPDMVVEDFAQAAQDLHPLSEWYKECVQADPDRKSGTTAGMIKTSIAAYFAPELPPEGHHLEAEFLKSRGHSYRNLSRNGKVGKYWDLSVMVNQSSTDNITDDYPVEDGAEPIEPPFEDNAPDEETETPEPTYSYPMEMAAR